MLIYLEAFMVSAGFKVSELDFIYAKATQDRLSPFRWSRAISSSRSRRCPNSRLDFHLRRLEMVIRPLTTAGS
jgi:hypothetical protein